MTWEELFAWCFRNRWKYTYEWSASRLVYQHVFSRGCVPQPFLLPRPWISEQDYCARIRYELGRYMISPALRERIGWERAAESLFGGSRSYF